MQSSPTFNLDTEQQKLETHAGSTVFERGQSYFEQRLVSGVKTTGGVTTATVEGTYPYEVTLRYTARGFDGYCSCPASDGFDFCKHCVATALTILHKETELAELDAGGDEQVIQAYLLRQAPEVLVELLLDAVASDTDLQQQLLLRAQIASGQATLKVLKRQITAATPMRDVWQWDQVSAYFRRFAAVLHGLHESAADIDAKDLLKLVDHAIVRLNKALERVDDSNGERWFVQSLIKELHVAAMQHNGWSDTECAQDLLDKVLLDPYDTFTHLGDYVEELSDASWEAYYLLARARLDALPQLALEADYVQAAEHLLLARILEPYYESRGEAQQLLYLAERTCFGSQGCYRLAELYLAHEQTEQAAKWLAQGDTLAGDRLTQRDLHVAVQVAQGNWQRAAQIQAEILQKTPSHSSYQRLCELAEQTPDGESICTWARDQLYQTLETRSYSSRTAAWVLAIIAGTAGDADEAYRLAMLYPLADSDLFVAAGWFAEQPRRACTLYLRAVDDCIERKDKPGYANAAKILVEAKPMFEAISANAFSQQVAHIRAVHKAKRNLMLALDEALGG